MAKSRYNSGGYSSSPNYGYNQPYGSYTPSYSPRYTYRTPIRYAQPVVRRYVYTPSYSPTYVTRNAFYDARKAVYTYKLMARRAKSLPRYSEGMLQPKQSVKNAYLRWLATQPKGVQLTGKMLICAKRQIRKQVLLATGNGGAHKTKPRFTAESQVRC